MFGTIQDLIAHNGYWVVAAIVALESVGVPAPGETVLVTAAIYAGTTQTLDITYIIIAASAGAIAGDNIGFLIGRRFGPRLLERYGARIGMDARRIRLGHYLFEHYGGWVVFLGRFVAVLRTLAAVLSGVNCMNWRRFLFFNATGGIVWATVFGTAGYALGEEIHRLRGPFAIIGVGGAILACIAGIRFVAHHQAVFQAEADREAENPASIWSTEHGK
ncbi:MAG: DedA family protein [Betaproteobacteria bacterium]